MSGVENVVQMILARAEEQKKNIIAEAEKEREIRLGVARKMADEKARELISRTEKEIRSELHHHEANIRLQAKQRLLKVKAELMDMVVSAAIEQIRALVNSDEYGAIFMRLVLEGVEALEEDEVELVLPRGHDLPVPLKEIERAVQERLGRTVSVTLADERTRSIAGVMVRSRDGTRWVDNTVEARRERMEDLIWRQVATLLFH